MNILYKVCCGLDVHKKKLVACLKKKGKKDVIKEFGAETKDIKELAEWLKKTNAKRLLWRALHHIGNLCGIFLK